MNEAQYTIQLEISDDKLAPFLACLAIGTLQGIRDHILPAEIGIWGLNAPLVFAPESIKSTIPQEILDVYATCDELSLMEQVLPDKLDSTIAELISRLQAELAKIDDPVWRFYLGPAPDVGDADDS